MNDFAGADFGSILLEGNDYDLSGAGITLNGSITVGGSGNTVGIDLTLGISAGLANTSSSTFTVDGTIDLNGNDLFVSNTNNGTVLLNDTVTGSGGITFSGNGTAVLQTANNYTGETLVSGGTLIVRNSMSLGTADAGTRVINASTLRIEDTGTIADEQLVSDDARLITDGNNAWTGDITDVGSDYLYLQGADTNSSLIIDGNVALYFLDARTGSFTLNGTNSTDYFYARSGANVEITGTHANLNYTYLYDDAVMTVAGNYNNTRYDTRLYNNSSLVVSGTYSTNSRTYIYNNPRLTATGTYTNANNSTYVYGTLDVDGSFSTRYGYIYGGGLLQTGDAATYSSLYHTYAYGGSDITGTGTVNAGTASTAYNLQLQSNSTISPGSSTGTGTLTTGDLLDNSGSNFDLRINGTSPEPEYDQLNVNGSVQLNGTLNISLGYTPNIGDSFTILSNDGTEPVSGAFAGLAEGSLFAIADDYFRISYQGGSDSNDVVLTVVQVGVWDGAPDGGGSSNTANWSEPANWVGDVAPANGANLIFPADALQTNNINDLTGASFGSILIEGDGYNLNGQTLTLAGSMTNQGSNTVIGLNLALATSAGLANTSSSPVTVDGTIDLNGNNLSVSNTSNGTVLFNNTVTGSGGITFSGNGTAVLQTANNYTGETLVSGGTLIVRNAMSLGTADAGTRVINASTLRIENAGTIADEQLVSDDARLINSGNNVWTGDITDVGSDYLYLWGADSNSSLVIEGNVTPYFLDVRTGSFTLNGTNSAIYTYTRNNGN